MSSTAHVLELSGHEVTVTHPDKVVFPRTGHTKLDLVRRRPVWTTAPAR